MCKFQMQTKDHDSRNTTKNYDYKVPCNRYGYLCDDSATSTVQGDFTLSCGLETVNKLAIKSLF